MRIHHIPVPSPFPIGPTNAYLLEGDPLTLIDTGVQSKAALRGLEQGLEALGHPLRKVERVIVTHGHQDHFGLAREVRERSGAEVWVHAWDAEWLETYDESYNSWVERGAAMARKGGMPGAAALRLLKFWGPLRRTAAGVEVARSLDDGDRFRVDDAEFQVLHTPGHCPGEIVVNSPGLGVLFCGDHVLRDVTPNPFAGMGERGGGLGPYMDSLQRVRDLDPRVAYTGHRDFIHDWRGVVQKILDHHEERLGSVLDVLGKKGGTSSAYSIVRKVFPRLRLQDTFLALGEIVGHLEVLEERGAVEAKERWGTSLYRKI